MRYPIRNHAQMGQNALSMAARTASSMDRKRPQQKTTLGDVASGMANSYVIYKGGKEIYKDANDAFGGNNGGLQSNSWSRNDPGSLPEMESPMERMEGTGGTVDTSSEGVAWNQHEIRGAPDTPRAVQAPTPEGGAITTPASSGRPSVPLAEPAKTSTATPTPETASALDMADGATQASELAGQGTQAVEVVEGAAEAGMATEAAAETALAGGEVAGSMAQGGANAMAAAELAEVAAMTGETAAVAETAMAAEAAMATSGTAAAAGTALSTMLPIAAPFIIGALLFG